MRLDLINQIFENVADGYDMIGSKFSDTRKFFWKDLEFIKEYSKVCGTVLDFGCGNGRLYDILAEKKVSYKGVDISKTLLNEAISKYSNNFVAFRLIKPNEAIPFKEDFFDTIYSISVFHHIPSTEIRAKIFQDLYKVLKKDGRVVISVWNLWQTKYRKKVYLQNLKKLFLKSELDWNDCYIPFHGNDGEIFMRYHHAFTVGSLKKELKKAGFICEICKVVNKKNIVFIGKKDANSN